MAAKSGLLGVPYEFPCDGLYVRYVWNLLQSVQGQLGGCSELKMLLQGCLGPYKSDQWW